MALLFLQVLKFLQSRQFRQVLKREHFQKLLRRSINDRTSRNILASLDAHQFFFQQSLEGCSRIDAPNPVDLRLDDGLAVGDDGKGLQGCRGQGQGLGPLETPYPGAREFLVLN